MTFHWKNPWADMATPVDIQSLAEVYNQYIKDRGGMADGMTGMKIPNYDILTMSWERHANGKPMDAYLLDTGEDYVSLGVRFSDEESDYYGAPIPREYADRVKRLEPGSTSS